MRNLGESITVQDVEDIKREARIENEVRRRLQDVLSAGGMASEGVAKEVLFWLPADFLDWYRDLFLKALEIRGRQALGVGSEGQGGDRKADLGKAIIDEKEYKGKRVGAGKGGASKRYYNGEWIIKDEDALDNLKMVNLGLQHIRMGFTTVIATPFGKSEDRKEGGQTLVPRVGVIVEKIMEKGRVRKVCDDCGKLMKGEFKRCPYHD